MLSATIALDGHEQRTKPRPHRRGQSQERHLEQLVMLVHAGAEHEERVDRERAERRRHREVARATRHPHRPGDQRNHGRPRDRPRVGIAELLETG